MHCSTQMVAAQLRQALGPTADEFSVMLTSPSTAPESDVPIDAAEMIARVLCSDDDDSATALAMDLVGTLWPRGNAPTQWWRTSLGRVIARAVGHPSTDSVSYSIAAAILGKEPHEIPPLVANGGLDAHPDGGITLASTLNARTRS